MPFTGNVKTVSCNNVSKKSSKRPPQKSPFLSNKIGHGNEKNDENKLTGDVGNVAVKAHSSAKYIRTEKNTNSSLDKKSTVKSNLHSKTTTNSGTRKIYSAVSILGTGSKTSPYSRRNNNGPSKENKSLKPSAATTTTKMETHEKSPGIGKRRGGTPTSQICTKTPIAYSSPKTKNSAKANMAPAASQPNVKTPKKSNTLEVCEQVKSNGFASPSIQQIPRNCVKKLVTDFEDDKYGPGRIRARKSLYQNFVNQRKSIGQKRKSGIANVGVTTEISQIDFSVTVAVRVRPFNQREAENQQVVFMNNQTVSICNGQQHDHKFDFDHSFWSFDNKQDFADQQHVYVKLAKPLLSAAFEGYNTCLFAYGQTGSGKSYTVMGYDEDSGIIPRFCDEMFRTVQSTTKQDSSVSFHIEMSYFEIYKEKIHDLLISNPNSAEGENEVKKQALRVREHPEDGPYVENLSTFVVRSFSDIQVWLNVGNRQRATASTGMNDKSSRSHSVFVINMVRTCTDVLDGEEHKSCRRSRINLIDLAGSERSSSAQTSGQRLKEAAAINKSLLTLGKVICALSEKSLSNKKQAFIPYRDSILTWLLKDSLGGNSRTAMIATISPAEINIEETISTLRYAAQARTIVNVVKINEDPNSKIIRELKAEIEKLRTKNAQVNLDEYRTTLSEVAMLRDKLSGSEKERGEIEIKWKQKLELTEKRKAREIGELKRAGVSFKVDNCLPNLVNLNEDPQLSEMLLYVIKRGVTTVGKRGNADCDIQLSGALIADVHCKIMNEDENVTISPVDYQNYKTYINGKLITKDTILHHGDRVIIGGDHFFRLNHPIEVQRMGKRKSKDQFKDFDFAKKEWIAAQTARMEKEIEKAKLGVENQYKQTIDALMERDIVATHELETIQEEKMALEREVNANRKRRDLEKKLLLEAKPVLEDSFSNDPLLLLVQSEKNKIQKDIEKLQKNLRNQKNLPFLLNDNESSDMIKLTTSLNEVNNISKELKKSTEFMIYGVGKDTEIKVVNKKMNIWTLWPVDKFHEKLEIIREAYEELLSGKEEYNEVIDNMFYDLTDTWNEILDSNTKSPSVGGKPLKPTRRSIRRISSLLLNKTATKKTPAEPKNENGLNNAIALCRNFIQTELDDNKICDSAFDHMLDLVNTLYSISTSLTNVFNANQSKNTSAIDTNDTTKLILKLTITLNSLQSAVKIFYMERKMDQVKVCTSVLQASKQLHDESTQMAFSVAKLLHGFENDLQSVIEDSAGLLKKHSANFSKCLGAIALSIKSSVGFISENSIVNKIKEAFMQGCNAYLRKTLKNKIQKLSASTEPSSSSNKLSYPEKAATLLSKILQFQVKARAQSVQDVLNRTFCASDSVSENGTNISLEEYYYNGYSYKCNILITTSALVNHVMSLKALFRDTKRDNNEIWNVIESVQKTTIHISELCGAHESFCNDLHDSLKKSSNQSFEDDSMNNSNSLSDDIHAAGLQLCESLDKILDEFYSVQNVANDYQDNDMTMSTSDVFNNNKYPSQNSIVSGSNNAISNAIFKWTGISERGSVSK